MFRAAKAADPLITDGRIDEAARSRKEMFGRAIRNCDQAVLDSLKRLADTGKKIALVSNADTMEIADWENSALAGLFHTAVFSCHAGVVKPEPEIYLIACEKIGVEPGDCVFVGDGGSDELIGAADLGMSAIQMTGIISRFWPELVDERRKGSVCRIREISELLQGGYGAEGADDS